MYEHVHVRIYQIQECVNGYEYMRICMSLGMFVCLYVEGEEREFVSACICCVHLYEWMH